MPTKIVQSLGNIPAARVTFFTGEKPELKPVDGQRWSIHRYKTDKKTETLRSSMAVLVHTITRAQVNEADKGYEFIDALLTEKQDDLLKRAADGELDFAKCEDAQFLVTDYFDNSRTASGKKVTGELLGRYFDDAMMSEVITRIVAKYPEWKPEQVEAVTKQYRTLWCDLAKYGLPHTKQATQLVGRLVDSHEFAEEYVELKEWAVKRVKQLQDKHNAAEMLVDAI